MKVSLWGLIALLAPAAGLAASGIDDATSAGRKLLHGARPAYPGSENGRWTESCVSIFFTVRADGRTDDFVLLESGIDAQESRRGLQAPVTREEEVRRQRAFVEPALKAVLAWQYAPAAQATEEIATFRFERDTGGHLMRVSARRLDLKSRRSRLCGAMLDANQVRKVVDQSRKPKG